MKISPTSRHNYSVLYRSKDGDFLGTRPPVKIPASDKDQFHRVTQSDVNRIDLLAYRYYGDCNLWWLIAEANNVSNPLQLEVGVVLRIPSQETIQMRIIR